MTRHEQRYKAMTILYQANLYDSNNISYDIKVDNNLCIILNEILFNKVKNENYLGNPKYFTSFSSMFIYLNNINIKNKFTSKESDKLANKYLDNWDINRLGFTDQAILRIGIYEILNTETPDVTCIDEAVELSKEYSDDKVCKMINGVLDKVYHSKN